MQRASGRFGARLLVARVAPEVLPGQSRISASMPRSWRGGGLPGVGAGSLSAVPSKGSKRIA